MSRASIGIIGVGNTIAGDDGAGILVLEGIRERLSVSDCSHIFFHELSGDMLEIWDLLDRADRFIFLDAVAGSEQGELVFRQDTVRAFAPSLHQAGICSIMNSLGQLRPLPQWGIWGITIHPPRFLGEGLSPPVKRAVDLMVKRLEEHLNRYGRGPVPVFPDEPGSREG